MSRSAGRWRGIALIGVISASTLWLAVTGQLGLYVAPRHEVFVTIMAVVGLVGCLLSATAPSGHEHAEQVPRWGRVLGGAATAISAVVAGTMLVIPPAMLTSATASQRTINSAPVDPTATDVATDVTANTDRFGIDDWATILRQTSDLAFYTGRDVTTTGFITADPDDPENMFYVSRFVITHCAIDAQAIGLPIYLPNWQDTLKADEWIDVDGEFGTNPSASSAQSIALLPDRLEQVEQPAEPYLYG